MATPADNNPGMTFDSSPVAQATTVNPPAAPGGGGMTFDAAPAKQPISVPAPPSSASSTPPAPDSDSVGDLASGATNVAKGVGKGVGDIWDMVKPSAIVSSAWHTFAPVALTDSVKQSLPLFDAYENARSNGASVLDAMKAANEKAQQQNSVRQALKQRVDEFQKNPTAETARAVTDLAGVLATAYVTHGVGGLGTESGAADAASEAAPEAVESGTKGPGIISKAANTIRKPFSLRAVQETLKNSKDSIQQELQSNLQNVQDTWHDNVRNLFDQVAKDAGVKPQSAESLHDVAANAAQAVKAKASGIYKQLDQAVGGTRFQTFDEQLSNVKRALRNSAGIDPDADGRLIERINQLEDAKAAALEQAKAAGVDPNLIHTANATHRQAMALEDLSKQMQWSISGLRADLSQGVEAAPESLSPAKLAPRANRMYNTGRLQQALGDDHADDLLKEIESTKQQAKDAAENAVKQTEAEVTRAQQQSDTVRTRRYVAGTALAGIPGFELLRHLVGD